MSNVTKIYQIFSNVSGTYTIESRNEKIAAFEMWSLGRPEGQIHQSLRKLIIHSVSPNINLSGHVISSDNMDRLMVEGIGDKKQSKMIIDLVD